MNDKTKRLLREEGGFTLPEMLVTMMLMLVVMSALYSIFDMSLRVFSFGNDKVEAVENARLGLEKMEREIRAAYPYDKTDNSTTNDYLFPPGSFTPNSITFGNDTEPSPNGDRKIDTATEQITYSLSGSTLQRKRGSLLPQPVVEYVQSNGLSFQYLDKNGNATATESQVAIVQISLDIEIDRGNLGTRTQTLTTDVALRNRED